MKKTLLEIVIDILNVIDGDEVNSISDTVESLQVAKDVENVYYDLIGRKDWQFLRKFRELYSLSDGDRPTHLLLPENASKVEALFYNKRREAGGRRQQSEVYFKYPDEFLLYVNQRDDTADNYRLITDVDGAKFTIRTDAHPTYFTSFDDKHIVMDAYDSDIEDTLQGEHSQLIVYMIPQWYTKNDFIPELPAEMFPLFISEAMTFCISKKEDNVIQKTEQTAKRHQRHLSQTHGRVQSGVRYPDYGRKSIKGSSTRRSAHFGPRS
jgi:hypothetical protein